VGMAGGSPGEEIRRFAVQGKGAVREPHLCCAPYLPSDDNLETDTI
jgi:hypothetical protein